MELHCPVDVIRVGEKGNTAAAASAYIACDQTVGHDGREHNYVNKPGLVAGGFLLPENVPERWRRDPASMWAEQDLIDYTKSTRRGPKSELYRAGRIGLPWDIPHERAAELAEELLEPLREKGMCVQWAIHDVVENGKRNYHMHWMAAMREATPEGFGKKCREWNKYNGGLNIPEMLRPHVAGILNRELEDLGSDLRVEHESFEARGIDRIPQAHMGAAATALEKERTGKNGKLSRPAIDTRKGDRQRYIEWLNQIHGENLRSVEAKDVGLAAVMGAAEAVRDRNSGAYKDWDALFTVLKDCRRCRAALKGEIKKLDKITGAYARLEAAETEEERLKERSYIAWAGCDPDDTGWKQVIQTMQHEARIGIRQMDATENLLLDSKELFKAHNRAVYTANKAAWDQYQIDRNKRSIAYYESSLESLRGYMDYLTRSLSIWAMIFRTQEWRDYCELMRELDRREEELRRERYRHKQELKQAKKDAKIHKAEAKQAAKEEKRATRQYRREHR